jgi:hypothetical protein
VQSVEFEVVRERAVRRRIGIVDPGSYSRPDAMRIHGIGVAEGDGCEGDREHLVLYVCTLKHQL